MHICHRLIDGIWTDEDIRDPLAKMTELLNKTSSREQVQRWGLWLTRKDPDLGLKVVTFLSLPVKCEDA